ncbi:synaptonemal complex protein 1 [Bombus vosnesenskii]|uniref:Synaptonemal complex protein 1 n=2 Tax=Pyrobombus TaxID=144703 RepID=A0A6J3KS55_9HYME|nr:synaptonemal complex protein 1 [Bombus vancouverensis nearcticus]XP_033311728.1 synaptonemal complex protein 1 [Bombus bifarius]XP_033354694.1 synaptonemal complex protein 1 [Bombus vosnesenskii]
MLFQKRIPLTFRKIKDVRWSTKDKLEQYRGILKLHAREKKIRLQDATKLKKKISWQLSTYKRDVNNYRQIVNEITKGIPKGHVRGLLRSRKNLRLKCQGREIEHICESICEENHRKRCQLDKLRYEKKQKMKRCFELQVEHAELCNIYKEEKDVPWTRAQQRLVSRYQKSVARQNAAKAINLTYAYILEILKKDAVYHEILLDSLKQDRISQCKVILRTTIMGQLATEETNDIESKYKRVARNVWNNMKEKERMLEIVREQVEDLWSYAQSLIRTESEGILTTEIIRSGTTSNNALEKQISYLEGIFDKIKDSLLVHSYRELLSRLEEQMKQRTRLLEQFDRNVKERDSLLSKKNEALSTLSNFEHALVATIEEYNADKNILLEQIAMQKKRELERKNSKKERGELLMDIRAALQNMVAMLICVKRGNKIVARKPTEEFDKRFDIPMMEKMETEGLALLSTVSRKVGALFGMSNFELDKDREERAKDLYQTYVSNYRSKIKFKDAEVEPTGLIVEHQAIDSSVPTRAEIKLRSKQAVEAYLRLE